ncbi:MAG: hypothetical protein DMG68_09445 [Acidobacteria bacterium]|jgi:hypothetical protein|nr:MAG: hypothetical protein DMG68_09445 [Acidobacteriota bacterium]
MTSNICAAGLLMTLVFSVASVLYGQESHAAKPNPIPSISADMGNCSVVFTVVNSDTKPVDNAKIRVRISYGFMSVRRLDLEVGTNVDGKARFEGLPSNLKRALFFRASKDQLRGTAAFDPAKTCTGEHTIVMTPARDDEED